MASLTTRLPLALGLLAAAATPAALATRSGLPDFDSEFMGQVLSYKRAQAKEVKEKVVEGVRSAGMSFSLCWSFDLVFSVLKRLGGERKAYLLMKR